MTPTLLAEEGLDQANALPGYYGVPLIHGSHWKWLVIWYFFFGGISGAAAVIAGVARLAGGRAGSDVSRVANYVSFAALVPCPPLLILDLGRPGRFLNMVRTFRPSSPMSFGSWGLTVFGAIASLNALHQVAIDRVARPGGPAPKVLRSLGMALAVPGAVLGFFVAGYTGTLLAATAVPLWSKRPAILGPLFLSSAMASGAAAVAAASALATTKPAEHIKGLHRLEAVATTIEGLLLAAWIVRLGETGRPLREGGVGSVVRTGVAGCGIAGSLAAGVVSGHLPPRWHAPLRLAGSLLALVGVFSLRYAVVEGGRLSADDPRATFDMTG